MQQLDELFRLYYTKTATAGQKAAFMELVQQVSDEELSSLIEKYGAALEATENILEADKVAGILQTILQQAETENIPKAPVRRLISPMWWAAAVLILLAGSLGYFYYYKNNRKAQNEWAALPKQQRFVNDIAPAQQQVLLTLADGTTAVMDSLADGKVVFNGATALKNGNVLQWQASTSSGPVYNTLQTQKGRVFHLRLPDGTNAWLDALSSIRFPSEFTGNERRVEVSGQVYFEVAHNKAQPFIVTKNNMQVQVLGTHFNVNAYDNEPDIKVTLLEGAVKVSDRGNSRQIQPGQQATVRHSELDSESINVISTVDLEQVMAWKEGVFKFNGSTVQQIMEQLSYWYDIEVVYAATIQETFVADMDRNLPISKLLSLLEMTGQVKFAIDGRRVTVYKGK